MSLKRSFYITSDQIDPKAVLDESVEANRKTLLACEEAYAAIIHSDICVLCGIELSDIQSLVLVKDITINCSREHNAVAIYICQACRRLIEKGLVGDDFITQRIKRLNDIYFTGKHENS